MASLVVSAAAIAAAGDPDPTFSGDGKLRTDFGAGGSAATAAVRQADGKIVAVGRADGNFLVARYNLDGSLDASFSGDGRTQTSFTGFDGAADVALQGNKIVVAGFSIDDTATGHFALARYNANGALDTTFSGDGKQTTLFGSFGIGVAAGVAIQSDGRIVAVGNSNFNGSHTKQFALARYRLNGSLDPSFSGDGRQTTSFEGDIARAEAVALQADGKIVVVGSNDVSEGWALARYNTDGSLDPSFSGDGRQTTGFHGWATGVAIQANAKIVAVGGTGGDFALARYNSNGSLDTSFGRDGIQTTDFLFGGRTHDWANDVAIQASGRIVAVGFASGSTVTTFALARYNTDGSLDPSFSGDGRKRTSFVGGAVAEGVALQGDGRIVAVGFASSGDTGNGEFALARYLGG